MHELLRKTGYFEQYDEVSETAIRDTLMCYPEYIDEWISYCQDKRTSSGWYIIQEDSTCCKVGWFSANGDRSMESIYVDRREACAAFIKHELEDIRRSSMKRKHEHL